MSKHTVRLTFLEPFRLLEWMEENKREQKAPAWMRGQSFVRWHKTRKNGKEQGRPYITGTLLRSAVLRAVEELLVLNEGRWDGNWGSYECCPGEFHVEGLDEKTKPKHQRQRSTLRWREDGVGPCTKDDPCLLCLLVGRFDEAGKGARKFDVTGKRVGEEDRFHVHFGNLSLPAPVFFPGPEAIGSRRVLNRVDLPTGKAHDFFHVCEIDGVCEFQGEIEIDDTLPHKKAILSLLGAALAFVDRLSGAACRVWLEDAVKQSDSLRQDGPSPALETIQAGSQGDVPIAEEDPIERLAKQQAERIAKGFDGPERANKLRRLADAVRELRRFAPERIENLPSGHVNEDGRQEDHFLWDTKIGEDETIRGLLKDAASQKSVKQEWRKFCEKLGQDLYEQLKELGDLLPVIRPLGKAEFLQSSESERGDDLGQRLRGGYTHEWIVTGELKAVTPFFLGTEAMAGKQTSLALLLDRNGHYRMPRSVLRGVLRRDLSAATGGLACKVELGPRFPCLCPVCQIMRGVTLRDAVSSVFFPPEIRHRIRMNPWTGIVDEGALFDMEVAPEGLIFPFTFRFRGRDESIRRPQDKDMMPLELRTVLQWWRDGFLFLGGSGGTGKGRFGIEGIHAYCWDLQQRDSLNAYVDALGFRGDEHQEILRLHAPSGLSVNNIAVDPIEFPWEKVTWSISFTGPVLTNDPLGALMPISGDDPEQRRDRADAVFYRKTVVKPDQSGPDEPLWTIKGESARGLVRSALGRRHGLLTKAHEDCACFICRIFGNEHEAGVVRFEDLTPVEPGHVTAQRLDHVAIDRFTGGAARNLKFDDHPLVGVPNRPLTFQGHFWVRRDLDEKSREELLNAFLDLRDGMLPVGAKGSIGYGWIERLEMSEGPAWLKDRLATIPRFHKVEIAPNFPETLPAPEWPVALPQLSLRLGSSATYHPHYFLKPDKIVSKRERRPIGHDRYHDGCYTGSLTCKLTTLTPLIIPDTSRSQTLAGNFPEGHQAYRFFRLGDDCISIQGAELRGVVSSVYEALTNSCLRIMDQKQHLSWRMRGEDAAGNEADNGKFRPGRVKRIIRDGKPEWSIREMEMLRVPVYDNQELDLAKQPNDFLQPSLADREIQGAAEAIRNHLADNSTTGADTNSTAFCRLKLHKHDSLSILSSGGRCQQPALPCQGYLKFSGPNKVEVSKLDQPPDELNPVPDTWGGVVHNNVENRPVRSNGKTTKVKKRNISFFRGANQSIKSGSWFSYEMSKRCERLFMEKKDGLSFDNVAPNTIQRFEQVLREYQENATRNEIPTVFRSVLPENGTINDNDLVYFRVQDWKEPKSPVLDIIPVAISRIVDGRSIGKHLPKDLRPCAHVCLEECEPCVGRDCLFPLYREGTPVRGLCPACHLFGSTGYRGRVRFGFAHLEGDPIWCGADEGPEWRCVTLPLLERPRPTWVMPDASADVPGRKFYVHHQGWKKVVDEGVNPITGESIEPNANNRTVEPLDAGNTFTFRIYFENLKAWELGLLLYSLELERDKDRKLAHKLGMGKALGFGSIRIEVQEILCRRASGKWNSEALDKAALTREGLMWLEESYFKPEECTGRRWSTIPRVEALRRLLQYEERDDVDVRYPRLKAEDSDDKPGYVELKDQNYRANRELTKPWSPWWSD